MSEFAVLFATQNGLFEDRSEQAPREFLAVKWNDREPSVCVNEFAVTAFAWEFFEARPTQFADEFLGSRRQRLPLESVHSHQRSVSLDAVLFQSAIQNVHGFGPSLAPGCSDRMAWSDPARGRVPKPTRGPLASSRVPARTNRPVTLRQAPLARNRAKTWVYSGLETPIRCTFACAQYRPELVRMAHRFAPGSSLRSRRAKQRRLRQHLHSGFLIPKLGATTTLEVAVMVYGSDSPSATRCSRRKLKY